VDRITENLLAEFVADHGLSRLTDSDAFERFANFCVVSREYSETFEVEDVSGPGQEVGIDGLAIIANGVLVTSPEEVEGLGAQNGFLEVTFIFVQAKRSGSFSEAAIGTFALAVKDFFSASPDLPQTDFIAHYGEIRDAVFRESPRFSRGKPHCHLSYVTSGKWLDDPVVNTRIATEVRDLEALDLFSTVELRPIGSDTLQQLYYRTKNPVEGEFSFRQRVTLPEIPGVSEAYLGVMPAPEYLKMITDDSGQIRRSLFDDNVRDFQGQTIVNRNIADTLRSSHSERFAVLNNGVTIVARELRITGDKLFMKDYQVVNGGQTSHVLFNESDELTEAIHVPVKVISTDDEDLTTAVIQATNNQTAIKSEELNARADFERKLERFFETYGGSRSLFYERRSRQYTGDQTIEKTRVITRQQLVRAFASMFLDEPHRATGYVPALMGQLGAQLFNRDHAIEPYYASAYGYYKLEFLWRNREFDPKFKPARWQLLMAARHVAVEGDLPPLNSRKVAEVGNRLLSELSDDSRALQLFERSAQVVTASTSDVLERDAMRNQQTTADVLASLATPAR